MRVKKRRTANTLASDSDVMDEDDAPELTPDQLKGRSVTWRVGNRVVSEPEGREAMRQVLTRKSRVNIHLDDDVIEFFKRRAGGRGYQTLINSTLRSLIKEQAQGRELRNVVQQTIREEFARRTTTEGHATPDAGVSTSDPTKVQRWNTAPDGHASSKSGHLLAKKRKS